MPANEGEKITSEIQSEGGSIVKQYSYVLHGGKAFCPCGSRTSRLQVPLCHGTYIHDMPVMIVTDTKSPDNIQPFGMCSNPKNPDRIAKEKEIMENVKESGGLLGNVVSGIGGFFKKVKSFFTGKQEVDQVAEDLKKNIVVACTPAFATNDMWEEGSEKLLINGVKALTSDSTIQCIFCGGGDETTIISIVEDGQENAAKEQVGAVDFDNWQEGDPYPNPTKRNLQALDANINKMEAQIASMPDGPEKKALQAELEKKQNLRSYMQDNVDMLDEISNLKLNCYPCDDPKGAVEELEKNGRLQEMMDAGQILDKNCNKVTDMNKAKELLEQSMKEKDARYKELEQTETMIKNNYNNGTPVVKMDWDKYNESVKSATKVMQDTVIDNQWAMVENVVLFGTSGAIMKPFKEKDASTELLKNLSENTDYSMPYSSFNGSAVSSENKGDVKYIYYNGSLLSDKEYKQKIADQATKNYNTQNGK